MSPLYHERANLGELKQQITQALGVSKFKKSGFSTRNIRCLFHDDKRPSASLHRDKGLWCHSCGEMFWWDKLAGKLGIAWQKSGRAKQEHRQLSDEVIQRMIATNRTSACRALMALYESGREGAVMTMPEILSLVPCSRETIDAMAREGIISANLPISYSLQEMGKEPEKITRGRPRKLFRIPTLGELEAYYGCDASRRHYTIEKPENAAELKAEVRALPIKRAPGKTAQLSVRYLMTAAGVKSPKTIRKSLKLVSVSRSDADTHELTIDEYNALPESYGEYKRTRENGSGWKYLEVRGVKYAYSKAQALMAIRSAGSLESVTVRTSRPNIYTYTGARPEMPAEIAETVRALESALIVRRGEVNEWEMLMQEMDTIIQGQQEQESAWRAEGLFTFKQRELVSTGG